MKNKKIDIKYWITIIIFVSALIGTYVGNRINYALLEDQVERNTETLEKHNLDIINYKLDEILKALGK